MDYFPINLKISYSERLDIQLFIRQQLQTQKFKRHWIYCKGFEFEEETKIIRTYLGFLSQGDLYKIKTSNFGGKWKQKTYEDIMTIMRKENDQTQMRKNKLDLKNELLKIHKEVREKQYNELIVATIFLSQSLSTRQIQEFSTVLNDLSNNEIILNIVAPEEYVEMLNYHQTWIRAYSSKDLKGQLRGVFSSLSRTIFRKVVIQLRCMDGDIVINQTYQSIAKSYWKQEPGPHGESQHISNSIYFPACNSPYIMSVQLKNMLKSDTCNFQIIMKCEDETGHVSQSSKSFSIKPTKDFMDWTDNINNNSNESKQVYRYQQMSLSFEEVNLYQKLHFMKIVGTPVRVMLKNRNQI